MYVGLVCSVFHGWPSDYARDKTLGDLAQDYAYAEQILKVGYHG